MKLVCTRLLLLFFGIFLSFTTLQAQQFISAVSAGSLTRAQLQPVNPLAQYGVDMYKVLYTTPDVKGVTDTASGLLIVPQLEGFAFPVLVAQHGTVTAKDDVPSNLRGNFEIGAAAGSLGYLTLMPDFLGLGESRGFHPYVHADSEASASYDMLLASETFLANEEIVTNGQLFITGYSQGGHASMALHRLIETEHSETYTVTAASHMAGPYAISASRSSSFLSDEPFIYPGYLAWTVMGYNEVYNFYDSLEQYMKQPYADLAMEFYTGERSLEDLHQALYDSLTVLAPVAAPRYMLQDSVIAGITSDPDHPVNVALRDNDTYDWAPKSPTRLLYCKGDGTVNYRNSIVADSVMRSNGAEQVIAVDMGTDLDHVACIQPSVFGTIAFFGLYQNVVSDVEELTFGSAISVYPNPAHGQFTVDGLEAGTLLQIYDFQGRLLQQEMLQNQRETISIDGLSTGMYVLKLNTPSGTFSSRLAVRK